MAKKRSKPVQDFLIRGHEQLESFPDFELVGREDVLQKLTAILMRKRANNVLLIGAGGVGCSAICLGLQQSKDLPDTPFDGRILQFEQNTATVCNRTDAAVENQLPLPRATRIVTQPKLELRSERTLTDRHERLARLKHFADDLPEQLPLACTNQRFRGAVHERDTELRIEHHDGSRQRLNQIALVHRCGTGSRRRGLRRGRIVHRFCTANDGDATN